MPRPDKSHTFRSITRLAGGQLLLYSPVLYTLGAILARYITPKFYMADYITGLLFIWNTQIMARAFKRYYIREDRISEAAVFSLKPGIFTLIIAVLIPLLFFGPRLWPLLFSLLIILLSFAYSAPLFRFGNSWPGEAVLTVMLYVLVPLLGYTLQTKVLDLHVSLLVTIPPAIIDFAGMMVICGIARRAAPHNVRRAIGIFCAALLLGYGSVGCLYKSGIICLVQAGWMMITAPAGCWIALRLLNGDQRYLPLMMSIYTALTAAATLAGVVAVTGHVPVFTDIRIWPVYFYFIMTMYLLLRKTLFREAANRP